VKKQETVIFATKDNLDVAKEQLQREGIGIDHPGGNGRLLVRKSGNPMDDALGFDHGVRETFGAIFSGVSGPSRLVMTTIPIDGNSGLEEINLSLERGAQDAFEGKSLSRDSPYAIFMDQQVSVMCPYKVDLSRNDEKQLDWMRKNAENHDRVIIVRKDGSTELFNQEDALLFLGSRRTEDELENHDDELDTKILESHARSISREDLGREIAELSNDLAFLESQVQSDLASYSDHELEIAKTKIARVERKLNIFKIELSGRQ